MSKNIIICCDGTDNKLTIGKNTNVIHLYSCLEKSDRQVTYYHPGVGTIAPSGVKSVISRNWKTLKDQVSAGSLEENVKDAYIFLMNNYEDDDKVYLFGFSRGAYTVRMLCGLVEMFGLIHRGNSAHLRYALEVYSKDDNLFHLANSFKSRFSREIKIHYIGIWDTVVAAGGLINFYKNFPYSQTLGIATTVRHALAIDERRKHYDCYHVSEEHKDCKEVFFAGVHSDVGGSYPQEGLSKITLEWMLGESEDKGLILLRDKVERYVYGEGNTYQRPDFNESIHNSFTLAFQIFDFIPRPRFSKKSAVFNISLDFRIGPRRIVKDDALIHKSVMEKIATKKYSPKNIKPNHAGYSIEESMRLKILGS